MGVGVGARGEEEEGQGECESECEGPSEGGGEGDRGGGGCMDLAGQYSGNKKLPGKNRNKKKTASMRGLTWWSACWRYSPMSCAP